MVTRRKRPSPNASLAIAYLRVSTDKQELGPEAQRATIEAWAIREGVTVVAWCDDRDVSGATPIDERQGFLDAITALREHSAGVLVAAKRDRIARDPFVAIAAERTVERLGARIVSADGAGNGDSDSDRFMRRILDAAAEHERALIRSRTRQAMAVKRARGERISRQAPYGMRTAEDGRTLVRDDAEQATLTKARELRASGLSVRGVAEELEYLGLMNRAGKAFGVAAVHAMLRP